jgi:hypothetical protein
MVSRFKNSTAFPGAYPGPTPAVVGPRAASMRIAAIERQIAIIRSANPHRLFESRH